MIPKFWTKKSQQEPIHGRAGVDQPKLTTLRYKKTVYKFNSNKINFQDGHEGNILK